MGLRGRASSFQESRCDRRPDAARDLQALLDRVYVGAGYEYYVHDGPPQPPLEGEEAAWAARFVPEHP